MYFIKKLIHDTGILEDMYRVEDLQIEELNINDKSLFNIEEPYSNKLIYLKEIGKLINLNLSLNEPDIINMDFAHENHKIIKNTINTIRENNGKKGSNLLGDINRKINLLKNNFEKNRFTKIFIESSDNNFLTIYNIYFYLLDYYYEKVKGNISEMDRYTRIFKEWIENQKGTEYDNINMGINTNKINYGLNFLVTIDDENIFHFYKKFGTNRLNMSKLELINNINPKPLLEREREILFDFFKNSEYMNDNYLINNLQDNEYTFILGYLIENRKNIKLPIKYNHFTITDKIKFKLALDYTNRYINVEYIDESKHTIEFKYTDTYADIGHEHDSSNLHIVNTQFEDSQNR